MARHLTRIALLHGFCWIAFIAALKTAAADAETAGSAKRPHVLFIAVDDLRPELGCYGQTHVKSRAVYQDILAFSARVLDIGLRGHAVPDPFASSRERNRR